MASFKSLLLRVEVRSAGKKCKCAHSAKHVILKGEPRVVVKAPGIATPEKGYCGACGAAMIARAESDLAELRSRLAVLP
jgi:uncharacterized Zn-binding protein involved in type VI secretion